MPHRNRDPHLAVYDAIRSGDDPLKSKRAKRVAFRFVKAARDATGTVSTPGGETLPPILMFSYAAPADATATRTPVGGTQGATRAGQSSFHTAMGALNVLLGFTPAVSALTRLSSVAKAAEAEDFLSVSASQGLKKLAETIKGAAPNSIPPGELKFIKDLFKGIEADRMKSANEAIRAAVKGRMGGDVSTVKAFSPERLMNRLPQPVADYRANPFADNPIAIVETGKKAQKAFAEHFFANPNLKDIRFLHETPVDLWNNMTAHKKLMTHLQGKLGQVIEENLPGGVDVNFYLNLVRGEEPERLRRAIEAIQGIKDIKKP